MNLKGALESALNSLATEPFANYMGPVYALERDPVIEIETPSQIDARIIANIFDRAFSDPKLPKVASGKIQVVYTLGNRIYIRSGSKEDIGQLLNGNAVGRIRDLSNKYVQDFTSTSVKALKKYDETDVKWLLSNGLQF